MIKTRDVLTIETRAVLAAAYKRLDMTLTHACRIGDGGEVIEVLCGRVLTAHMADSGATDPTAAPTCPRCRNLAP